MILKIFVEGLPVVEENVQRNISIYNFVNQEGQYNRKLDQGIIIGKFDKTVTLLRFHNYVILTNNIDSFFNCFLIDIFFWIHPTVLTSCRMHPTRFRIFWAAMIPESNEELLPKERVWAPRNLVGKTRRVHSSGFWGKRISNFRFDSICVHTKKLKETQTTWLENLFQFQSLYHRIWLMNSFFLESKNLIIHF